MHFDDIIFQVETGKQDGFYSFISHEQMTVLCRDKLKDIPGILMDEI
jgi:hypothetical protein